MKNRALIGALATALVVGLVVAGLLAVGSPGTARKLKADQERRSRLTQIHYVLSAHVRQEESLPASLESIDDEVLRQSGYGYDPRNDPDTGELFEYRRLSNREYEICATFHSASDDPRAQEFGAYPGDVSHKAGRNCFDREITEQDLESAFIPGLQEGFPRPGFPPRLVPSETTRPTTEPSSPVPPLEPIPSPSSV